MYFCQINYCNFFQALLTCAPAHQCVPVATNEPDLLFFASNVLDQTYIHSMTALTLRLPA